MKQTTTLIFLFFVFNLTFGQKDDGIKIPKIEETDKYGFTEIYELDSLTSKELYNSTKIFLTKKHSDKEFFIDIPEKELYDNGSFPANMNVSNIPITYTILYTISTEFKESKIRITISDFKVSTNSQGTTSEVVLENHFNNMNAVKSGKKYALKNEWKFIEFDYWAIRKTDYGIKTEFDKEKNWMVKKPVGNTVYKKLLVLAKPMLVARLLASDFPSENPRTQTRNFPYTKRCSKFEKNQLYSIT